MSKKDSPADRNEGSWLDKLTTALEDYETHLEVKKGLTSKTASQHTTMARVFLEDVETLSPTDDEVMAFRRHLMEEGYSNSHINNTQNAIEYYFEFIGKEEEIDDYRSLPRKNKDPNPLSKEERAKMYQSYTTLREEAVLRFLFSSGVRNSSTTLLKFRDIDFEERSVEIVRAKGHNEYNAIISEQCAEVLDRYKTVRGAKDDDPVFKSRSGDHLTRSGLLQLLQRIGERAGIEDITVHRCRATFANRLRKSGADIYHIKELMGHADIRSTVRYLTMDLDELRREHDERLDGDDPSEES